MGLDVFAVDPDLRKVEYALKVQLHNLALPLGQHVKVLAIPADVPVDEATVRKHRLEGGKCSSALLQRAVIVYVGVKRA